MLSAALQTRLACIAIGYACGCFLTADAVARKKTGKWARQLGSRNPGMSNVGALFGVRAAAVVLAGDIGKTLLAAIVCQQLLPLPGRMAVLWAGLGATLGHNFPFWTGFRGGKGVTVTCTTLIWFDPIWGTAACAAGLAVMLATKQPCFGAGALVTAFLPCAYLAHGPEALAVACVLAALMFAAHGRPMLDALAGREPETDLLALLRARMRR